MLYKLLPMLWFVMISCTVKISVMESYETIRKPCVNEQDMVILFHDETNALRDMTDRITRKMQVDIYDIEKDQVPDASQYDIVILADTGEDGHPSQDMREFLGWYDLGGNTVSSYWIGNQESYEKELQQLLRNAKYVSGLGNDGKDVEDQESWNAFINGWLTSICSADKNR